jgi:hypothetical protein
MALSENGVYSVVYRGCKEMPEATRRDLNATNAAIQEVLSNGVPARDIELAITASGILASEDGHADRLIDCGWANVLLSGSREKQL